MKTFATASVVLLFVLGASSARAGFDEGLAAHRRGGLCDGAARVASAGPAALRVGPVQPRLHVRERPGRAAGLCRGNEAVSGETVGPDDTLMVVATPPPAQDCCAGANDGEKAPPISD